MRRLLTVGMLLLTATVGLVAMPLHGHAQSDQKAPAFEVASVKPNTSGENRISIGIQPGGGFRAIGAPLRELIGLAYGIPQPLTSFMVGGPNWIDTDHFDILAKADHDWQASANGPPADFPPMLQTLLADRFQLMVHHDRREMPIYALVVARADGVLGPHLHDRLRGDDGSRTCTRDRPSPATTWRTLTVRYADVSRRIRRWRNVDDTADECHRAVCRTHRCGSQRLDRGL
jgi:uncharacterized protein (TIGR03435 family)